LVPFRHVCISAVTLSYIHLPRTKVVIYDPTTLPPFQSCMVNLLH